MNAYIIKNRDCKKNASSECVEITFDYLIKLFSKDGISDIQTSPSSHVFETNKPYLALQELPGYGVVFVSIIYFTRINGKMVMLEATEEALDAVEKGTCSIENFKNEIQSNKPVVIVTYNRFVLETTSIESLEEGKCIIFTIIDDNPVAYNASIQNGLVTYSKLNANYEKMFENEIENLKNGGISKLCTLPGTRSAIRLLSYKLKEFARCFRISADKDEHN